ncbi:hypothetical protein ASPACDRAFT_109787 [Aspergillus aculeatus ATCC 16872]|uniref:RecA family profile 1 domain-containing protein n=1 Tax=Aspergillus aculeatus (strain ATCC 16872 / CBS 172.66 / WB 5094) TaxID=690307 RepID=A0A1L9X927_ASPA1|nr:uncharacterized protein ASPACDRAFT_109787 [Aspergillus aculeatus ATCC 16872]OJK04844.1 hypothetical protein ASPACDRAFT_109787 [Aspergillus aculeatus ATCC 16872]
MDLLSVLPDFPTKRYSHILPPLERNHITTVDLITLDTLEIAKRAHVPAADVRRLSTQIIRALHHDVGFEEIRGPDTEEPASSLSEDLPVAPGPASTLDLSQWSAISTLDLTLDALLDGGIPTRYVTEVTGESGSGKTQFLLTLLLAVQLPAPRGLAKNAIYISTEAPLSTPRLSQLMACHPYLSEISKDQAPSLERVLSINAMDLESQDHILNYQLPVAIKRYNVGLVVIDSITSNYRAEHSSHNLSGLSTRSGELAKLGQLLRNLAVAEDIAIVVANQVSDRIDSDRPSNLFRPGSATTYSSAPSTQQPQQQRIPRAESGAGGGALSPFPHDSRAAETSNVDLTPMNHHHGNVMLAPSSQPPFSSSPFPLADDDPQQQQQQQQQFDGSYLIGNPVRNEILSLVHQQRFFTGWGDTPQSLFPSYGPGLWRSTSKTPTLGLVWSTQIACRIALKKETRSFGVFDFEGAYDDEEFSHRDASQAIKAPDQIIGPTNVKGEHEGALLDITTTTITTTSAAAATTTSTSQEKEQKAEIANSESEPEELEPSDDAAVKFSGAATATAAAAAAATDEQSATTIPNPTPSSSPRRTNPPPDTQQSESPSPAPTSPQAPTAPSPATANPSTTHHHHHHHLLLPSTQRTIPQTIRRTFKVVFAPWTGGRKEAGEGGGSTHNPTEDQSPPQLHQPSSQEEVEFEIWKGGIRGCSS